MAELPEKHWLIDDAPGERFAALREGKWITELHLWRPPNLLAGQVVDVRILQQHLARGQGETDDGQRVLIRSDTPLIEGSTRRVHIRRAAYCEPENEKLALGQVVESDVPCRSAETVWEDRTFGRKDIPIGQWDGMNQIVDMIGGPISTRRSLKLPHPLSGELMMERTAAGLVFDVDGKGDAVSINLAAAKEIARLLRLFQVGGSTLVDFITMESKAERKRVADAFANACLMDNRFFEMTAMNGFGLIQLIRPRTGPSIIDQVHGTKRDDMSALSAAFMLMRRAIRHKGIGPRQIRAIPSVAARLLSPHFQPLLEEAAQKAGAPITIVADAGITGYGHVHVAQR